MCVCVRVGCVGRALAHGVLDPRVCPFLGPWARIPAQVPPLGRVGRTGALLRRLDPFKKLLRIFRERLADVRKSFHDSCGTIRRQMPGHYFCIEKQSIAPSLIEVTESAGHSIFDISLLGNPQVARLSLDSSLAVLKIRPKNCMTLLLGSRCGKRHEIRSRVTRIPLITDGIPITLFVRKELPN